MKKGGAKALKVHEALKVLNPVVQNPVGEHKFTLVYLHGFGSSADAFFHAQFAGLSELEKFGVRVVLPNAPERKITYEKGEKMPAWYDYNTNSFGDREDKPHGRTL